MRNSLWPTRCPINGLGLLNGSPSWVLAFLLRVHKLSIPPVLRYISFSSLMSILPLFAEFNFRRWNHWHFPNEYSLRNKILCMVYKQWGTWLMGSDLLLSGWTGWQAHYSQMRGRRCHLLWPHEWDSGTEQPRSSFLRNQRSISAGAMRTQHLFSFLFPPALHFSWWVTGQRVTHHRAAACSNFLLCAQPLLSSAAVFFFF